MHEPRFEPPPAVPSLRLHFPKVSQGQRGGFGPKKPPGQPKLCKAQRGLNILHPIGDCSCLGRSRFETQQQPLVSEASTVLAPGPSLAGDDVC